MDGASHCWQQDPSKYECRVPVQPKAHVIDQAYGVSQYPMLIIVQRVPFHILAPVYQDLAPLSSMVSFA